MNDDNIRSDELASELDLQELQSWESIDRLVTGLGHRGFKTSIDTFHRFEGHWYFKFKGRSLASTDVFDLKPRYDQVLDGFSGDVIDQGSGSWTIVGKATGNRTDGQPLNVPFNIEYVATDDKLIFNYGSLRAEIASVSGPASPMQIKVDVSLPKFSLVVRERIPIGLYVLDRSSFLTL